MANRGECIDITTARKRTSVFYLNCQETISRAHDTPELAPSWQEKVVHCRCIKQASQPFDSTSRIMPLSCHRRRHLYLALEIFVFATWKLSDLKSDYLVDGHPLKLINAKHAEVTQGVGGT